MGGFFDPVENIRRPSEMNKMREVIFLSSARKPDVDFDDVWFQFGGNEKIDPEIHGGNAGLPPFMGGSPKETLAGRFALAGCREFLGDLLDRHIIQPPFNTPRA